MHTRVQLSAALSALRQSSGYSVRELATRLGIPVSTLGGYLTGRHLPSASQLMTYTAMLRECGITDAVEVERWVAALTRARASSDRRSARGEAPYRGLEPFGTDDARWFFGRDEILGALVSRIVEVRADPDRPRVIPLVGPSGAGKSSLLHAGLLAAVARGDVDGVRNATALVADALPAELPELVVIDGFDGYLTDAADLLDRLGDAIVVIGLRADYYAEALEVAALVPALQRNQVLITPLTRDELRDVVVQPAQRAGAVVEPALVDVVLADLGVDGRAHDPGTLPLLSHALLATWVRATRNQLTVADYRDVGGISGAVQKTAEDVWADLDAEDQQLARQLFLRLVHISDDAATLTRRRIDRSEIDGSESAVNTLVDTFVSRRLLTADFDVVQISHEALLTAWPRLHTWIDEDRESLRLHRRLTDATNQWVAAGRDSDLLVTGGRLTAIADWAAESNHAGDLNRVETEFLDASVAAATARRAAEHHQNQRLKRLLAVVAVLTVLAVALAVVALYARGVADRQRSAANQARDEALSRQVAVEVASLLPKSPDLAAQLAATSYEISPTGDARSALLGATDVRVPTRLVVSGRPVQAVAVHDDVLAADGADGKVHLWRMHDNAVPMPIGILKPSNPGTLFALAISPDGKTLAAGGAGNVVDLWSLPSARHLTTLTGFDNTIFSLAFSPDGRTLAVGGATAATAGTVHRFSLHDPTHPQPLPALDEPSGYVQAVSFDASGDRLAYVTKGGDLVLYRDAASPEPTLTARRHVSTGVQFAVAFDPTRPVVATGGDDSTLRTWRVDDAGRLSLSSTTGGFDSWINALTWDRSGNLYAASSDNKVHIVAGKSVTTLPHPEPVTAVAVSGGLVVTAAIDGTVRIWPSTSSTLTGLQGTVFSLGYSRTHVLAAGSSDGHIALWRAHRLLSDPIAMPGSDDSVDGASAISPDGTLVAGGSGGGRTALWSIRDPSHPQYLGVLPGIETGASTTVEGLAFSPDNHLLAAGGDDRKVRVWSVTDPHRPRLLETLRSARNYVFSVAFSHDGRYLAAASADDHAYVWSISGRPRLLGRVSGFSSYAYAAMFSPVGDMLAVGSADSTVRLFDVHRSGAPTPDGARLTGATDSIYALAFNPSGTMLAGASQDGSAYVWNVAAHKRMAALPGGGPLSAIAFDPSGATIAAAGSEHDVHLWDASAQTALQSICARAGTPLSHSEWRRFVPGAPYAPACH
ncbi:MAG TPA: helix-turn-helix domain-containing protein [Jatrophihabitans sp.]